MNHLDDNIVGVKIISPKQKRVGFLLLIVLIFMPLVFIFAIAPLVNNFVLNSKEVIDSIALWWWLLDFFLAIYAIFYAVSNSEKSMPDPNNPEE